MEDRFADKFRIKSGRLENWNYSSSGIYFITICTLNHNRFFGKIENNKMYYSDKGLMAYKCLIKMPIHFTNIELLNYVIMPNHVHILLKLNNDEFIYSRDAINRVSTNKKFILVATTGGGSSTSEVIKNSFTFVGTLLK